MKRRFFCLLFGLLLPVLTGCAAVETPKTSASNDLSSQKQEAQPQPEQGTQDEKEQSTAPSVDEPAEDAPEANAPEDTQPTAIYVNITQDEAKALMDSDASYVIVDVREQYEYDEGHIPGAVLLPLDGIDEASAAATLPDKNVTLLVYCRSGRRSKLASEKLLQLGYTDIREFGGIIDWQYEIVK